MSNKSIFKNWFISRLVVWSEVVYLCMYLVKWAYFSFLAEKISKNGSFSGFPFFWLTTQYINMCIHTYSQLFDKRIYANQIFSRCTKYSSLCVKLENIYIYNVCFIKIRSKLSSVLLLCLLRIFMKQSLFAVKLYNPPDPNTGLSMILL